MTGRSAQVALNVTGDPVSGLQWTLNYPAANFTSVQVMTGSAAEAAGKSISCNGSAGTLTCVAVGMNANPIPAGVVALVGLSTATADANTPDSQSVSLGVGAPVSASSTAESMDVTASGNMVTILKAKPSLVSPSSVSMRASQTQQFSADTTVTWSISPASGTISAAGLYTAPSLIPSAQTVTVKATSVADPTIFATATINLNPVTISISPASAQLSPSQTRQFSAAVTDASNTAVTWSISPSVGTISSSGLYSAPATISSQQTVVVTATSVADTSKRATASVTLTPPAQSVSVSISPVSVALLPSQTLQFAATVTGTTNTAVTWTLSPSVGTISSSGLYIAPATVVSQQLVTVTARSVADTTKLATATVTLTVPPPPVSISVTPASVTLSASQSRQFTATVTGTTNTGVTWTRTPAVGTITSAGLYTAPSSITTQQTVTVTATSVADASKLATAVVTLEPPVSATAAQAAYSFNSRSGSTAPDASGNQNTGTVNGADWTKSGKFGYALQFNGSSDYVRVNASPSLDLTRGTLGAWVRLSSLGRWHGVIAKGSTNDDGRSHNYAIEVNTANRVVCAVGNGSMANTVTSTSTVPSGQYVHLACTFDGSSLRLYINGSLNNSTAMNITPAGNSSPLFIGQYGGNVDRLSGRIDEVRIYNRALSQSEVQADMNKAIKP